MPVMVSQDSFLPKIRKQLLPRNIKKSALWPTAPYLALYVTFLTSSPRLHPCSPNPPTTLHLVWGPQSNDHHPLTYGGLLCFKLFPVIRLYLCVSYSETCRISQLKKSRVSGTDSQFLSSAAQTNICPAAPLSVVCRRPVLSCVPTHSSFPSMALRMEHTMVC